MDSNKGDDDLKPDAEASSIIPDRDLIDIDIKELNKMLKERGVAKELSGRLKKRRRTLKNRNYASSCREKKDEEISGLEKLKGIEVEEVTRMEEENRRIREEIDQMEKRYDQIAKFARDNNLDVTVEPHQVG